MDSVEREQKDRIDVVRAAFKTQLNDALVQIHSYYSKEIKCS